MLIRVAATVPESYVDGAGIRFAVFFQGCLRRCRGCHNPATHDVNGGKVFDVGEIITQFKDRPIISGITLTGGEESISFDDVASLFGGGE